MKPRNARTEKAICRLNTDNKDTDEYWICMNGDGEIVIAAQKVGESTTGKVKIPRKDFNVLVDWYNKDQKTRIVRKKKG